MKRVPITVRHHDHAVLTIVITFSGLGRTIKHQAPAVFNTD
ncbi:MAG: hypothetical protein ACE5D4_05560 [Thermodesulfobacteriota bacterium]